MEDIKCPKCGSSQISSQRKGFSGGKAVAGAALTGGIGLLAGTIGSNKVNLCCLKCGNQFKPGEDMDTVDENKLQRNIQNEKIRNSTGYKVAWKILLGIAVVFLGIPFFIMLIIYLASLFK